MPSFTVEKCEAANTFKNDYGEFQVWKLQIHDGEKSLEADLNTKLGKSGPSIGERIEGELTKGQYGYKLKRAAQNGGGKGAGWKPRDPKEQAVITRQHSQEMAILWAATLEKQGRLPADAKVDTFLREIIDWFQADAEAAKAAG